MLRQLRTYLFILTIGALVSSCDKGYTIRFSNYYIEPMDSVLIGDKIKFTNIEKYTSTDFAKITRGNYKIVCISKSKKKFNSSIFISGKGEGKRTVQLDAANQISILEE
jgi:hypothetical protein